MRELLSRKDLLETIFIYDNDYYFNIDEAIKSLFQARTIIRKYIKTNDIKDKSLINHVIIVNNILGVKRTNYAFYNTFDDKEFSYVKSILLFMDIHDKNYGDEIEHDEPLLDLFVDTLNRYKTQS